MGKFEKAYEHFMSKPAPRDIKLEDVRYLAERLGFKVEPGGKHPLKISDPQTGEVFPVPEKNGYVKWVYVARLQEWFAAKKEEQR